MTSAPRTLGRYALIGPLGPGRRSTLAWDPDARCMVVITTPRPGVDPARFVAAAHAAAQFPHPHIASIRAVEELDGTPLIVSTFVRGHALGTRSGTGVRTALVPALHQVADLCDTLAFANDRAMLHRPFSPDDVIVDREGEVMLVGAGIVGEGEARPTEAALVADVGAMLYALLTTSGPRRTNPRSAGPIPLATLRPDLNHEAATFIDAWVTARYAAPLATVAGDLRTLAACTALPSPAAPASFSPAQVVAALDRPAATRVTQDRAYDTDVGTALDVFKSEVPVAAPEIPVPAEPPVSMAALPRIRRRRSRSLRLTAFVASAALVLFALWRFAAPQPTDVTTAPAADSAPAGTDDALTGAGAVAPAISIKDEGEPPPAATPAASTARGGASRGGRAPEATVSVQPQYPDVARQAGVVGDVVADVAIAPDGRVSSVTVVSGPAILRGAARAALREWRFRPAEANGAPTATVRRFRVSFAAPAAPPSASSAGVVRSSSAGASR